MLGVASSFALCTFRKVSPWVQPRTPWAFTPGGHHLTMFAHSGAREGAASTGGVLCPRHAGHFACKPVLTHFTRLCRELHLSHPSVVQGHRNSQRVSNLNLVLAPRLHNGRCTAQAVHSALPMHSRVRQRGTPSPGAFLAPQCPVLVNWEDRLPALLGRTAESGCSHYATGDARQCHWRPCLV